MAIKDAQAIKQFIEEREINHLVHVTNVKNLDKIFEYGLLSRQELDKINLTDNFDYHITDEERYDGYTIEPVCLSITNPNKKMFYYKVKHTALTWNNLCILYLKPSILYKKECLFFYYNASSNECRKQDPENFRGINAFRKLFAEQLTVTTSYDIKHIQRDENDNIDEPTSIQAEVLCFDKIESEYIQTIEFYSDEMLEKYQYLFK